MTKPDALVPASIDVPGPNEVARMRTGCFARRCTRCGHFEDLDVEEGDDARCAVIGCACEDEKDAACVYDGGKPLWAQSLHLQSELFEKEIEVVALPAEETLDVRTTMDPKTGEVILLALRRPSRKAVLEPEGPGAWTRRYKRYVQLTPAQRKQVRRRFEFNHTAYSREVLARFDQYERVEAGMERPPEIEAELDHTATSMTRRKRT